MNGLLIRLGASLDIVTNSSSEVFICDTNKDAQTIRSYLGEVLSIYNETYDRECLFPEVFGDIFVSNVDVTKYGVPDDSEHGLLALTYGTQEYEDFEKEHENKGDYWEKYKETRSKVFDYFKNINNISDDDTQQLDLISEALSWGYIVKKGDIIVYSASDNSIPWEVMNIVEDMLNANRIHLG